MINLKTKDFLNLYVFQIFLLHLKFLIQGLQFWLRNFHFTNNNKETVSDTLILIWNFKV